ncbi:MAG: hypothetical protein QOE92_169 [Chloroflexota bacterium]|jgi:hypothetical protein|nr:hypothetical protein [Chloroflexota bacterium]
MTREPDTGELFLFAIGTLGFGLLFACDGNRLEVCQKNEYSGSVGADGGYAIKIGPPVAVEALNRRETWNLKFDAPAAPGETAGPAADARFFIASTTVPMPDLRLWRPGLTYSPQPRVQGLAWDPHPEAAKEYAVVYQVNGVPIWTETTTEPKLATDSRDLEDLHGNLAVAVPVKATGPAGDLTVTYRSQSVAFAGTAGPPPSRGKNCLVQARESADRALSPCFATDGDMTTGYTPPRECETPYPQPVFPSPRQVPIPGPGFPFPSPLPGFPTSAGYWRVGAGMAGEQGMDPCVPSLCVPSELPSSPSASDLDRSRAQRDACLGVSSTSLVVDLGDDGLLDLVLVRGGPSGASVATSGDGVHWTESGRVETQATAITLPPRTAARYVRVQGDRGIAGLAEVSAWRPFPADSSGAPGVGPGQVPRTVQDWRGQYLTVVLLVMGLLALAGMGAYVGMRLVRRRSRAAAGVGEGDMPP